MAIVSGPRGRISNCREHGLIAYPAGGVAPFTAQQIDRDIAGHAKNESLPVADRETLFVIRHGVQTYPGLLERFFRDVRRIGVVAEPVTKAPPMSQIDPDQIFACTENIRRHDNAITLANAAWFMAAAPSSDLEYKTFLKLSSYYRRRSSGQAGLCLSPGKHLAGNRGEAGATPQSPTPVQWVLAKCGYWKSRLRRILPS